MKQVTSKFVIACSILDIHIADSATRTQEPPLCERAESVEKPVAQSTTYSTAFFAVCRE